LAVGTIDGLAEQDLPRTRVIDTEEPPFAGWALALQLAGQLKVRASTEQGCHRQKCNCLHEGAPSQSSIVRAATRAALARMDLRQFLMECIGPIGPGPSAAGTARS